MAELEEKIKSILDSPDSMNKIMQAAQSLMGTVEAADEKQGNEDQNLMPAIAEDEDNFLEKLDPRVITTAMNMMNEYRKNDDRRIQLLHAMRAYFKNEDQVHINKAIQIVKLSKIAKQAFNSLKEGDSFV